MSARDVFRRLTQNSLLSGSATYLLSNILNAVVPFALMPVLTRYLTTEQYGEVAMFQTVLAVLNALTGLSVHGAAGRKYYDIDLSQRELKFFIGSCFQILFLSSGVVIVGLLFLEQTLSQWLDLSREWIWAAFAAAAATFAFQMRLMQWQARKDAAHYGAMQIANSVANGVISLILVVVFGMAAAGRIWAQLSTSILFGYLAVKSLYKDDLLGFAWRPRYLTEALGFGVPLIPHTVGLLLLGIFDRFMVNSHLGLAQVGVYMVAVQLVSPIGLLFDSVHKAYVPWLYERLNQGSAEENRRLVKLTYAYFAIVLTGALVTFQVGPFAVRIIAGERYADAGEVIGWLALGQAFLGMYLMVTTYIFYSKKTGLLSVVSIGSGLVNVALVWLLIDMWGMVGAAIASTTALSLRFFMTWWVAQKRQPMPWFNLRIIV